MHNAYDITLALCYLFAVCSIQSCFPHAAFYLIVPSSVEEISVNRASRMKLTVRVIQVSSKAASPDREQVERRPAEQTAQDALQPDAPAAAEDLPAPTTQQQSMPVADQPPAKDKKEKKKAKAATDELQGASEFAAAQNSKMGKKRKKHSEHTAAATEDLQGTAGTSAALEHLPQAGSATQADALADRPAAASKPGQLFRPRLVTGSYHRS